MPTSTPKITRKLQLNRETLRSLQSVENEIVRGGTGTIIVTITNFPSTVSFGPACEPIVKDISAGTCSFATCSVSRPSFEVTC